MSPLVALLLPTASALSLDATEILTGGGATLTARDAAPGAWVAFVAGTPGAGPCPAPLGGACLGVVAPTLLGAARADVAGIATLAVAVPANAPLVDLHLQAAHGGPTPAVSPVLDRPVLQEVFESLTIADQASYEAATHTVRVLADPLWPDYSGGIWFYPGNYPAVVELPHLERIEGSWISLHRQSEDLDLRLPRLQVVTGDAWADKRIVVEPGSGDVSVSMPELTSIGSGDLRVEDRAGSTTVLVPRLQALTDLFVQGNTGPFRLVADGLETLADDLWIARQDGAFEASFASLHTVGRTIRIDDSAGVTTLDGVFPALASVGDHVQVSGNANLASLQDFGSPAGTVVQTGDLSVSDNPVLVDATGLFGVQLLAAVPRSSIRTNPMLPSCQAYFVGLAAGDTTPSCTGNAVDACSDQANDPCR